MKKTPTAAIPLAIRDSLEYVSDEGKGRLLSAILDYAFDGRTPERLEDEGLLFWTVKAFLDEEKEHRQSISQARSDAGKKGGRPAQKEQKTKKAKKAIAFNKKQKKQLLFEKPIAFDGEEEWEIVDQSKKVVVQLILQDGTYYDITQEYIDRQRELYEKVDILAEVKAAVAWSEANPGKRKTRVGATRFLNAWLKKAQDRGGSSGLSALNPKAYYNPMFEYAEQLKKLEGKG